MDNIGKLRIIKIVHTIIWLFFNVVFFYMATAIIINKIDVYVWVCIALFMLEILVLLIFKNSCPLTILARKYSTSTKDNFDIYLPNGLAKYNKLIYGVLLIAFICGLIYRLMGK